MSRRRVLAFMLLAVVPVGSYALLARTERPIPRATWSPVGTPPLADARAAALITRRPEVRAKNAAANAYVPSDSELSVFRSARDQQGRTPVQYNSMMQYVTGRPGLSNPSTDDLIQWTAKKWGIPEDLIRAQMVVESGWNQHARGDRQDGVTASLYPAQSRIDADSVYESLGIAQIKWRPDGTRNPGTEPLRWKSTAFNLDFYGATVRYYYDGRCPWCSSGYSAGQEWASIGAWFQPSPWNNSEARSYIQKVQSYLSNRLWPEATE